MQEALRKSSGGGGRGDFKNLVFKIFPLESILKTQNQ